MTRSRGSLRMVVLLVCLVMVFSMFPVTAKADTGSEQKVHVILSWYRQGIGEKTSNLAFVQDGSTWAPKALVESIYADIHYTEHTPNVKTPTAVTNLQHVKFSQGVEHVRLITWTELNGVRLDRTRNAYGVQVMELNPTAESILQQPSSMREYNSPSPNSSALNARLQRTVSVGGRYFTVQELLGENVSNPLVTELLKFDTVNDLWAHMANTNGLTRSTWNKADYETFRIIESVSGGLKYVVGDKYPVTNRPIADYIREGIDRNLPEKLQDGTTLQYWQLGAPVTSLDTVSIFRMMKDKIAQHYLDIPLFGIRFNHTGLKVDYFPSEQRLVTHEVFSARSVDGSYTIIVNRDRGAGTVYAADIADDRAKNLGLDSSQFYRLGDVNYRGVTINNVNGTVTRELYRVSAGSSIVIKITAPSIEQLQTISDLHFESMN